MELVARRGRYYGPLAPMMLAVIHLAHPNHPTQTK